MASQATWSPWRQRSIRVSSVAGSTAGGSTDMSVQNHRAQGSSGWYQTVGGRGKRPVVPAGRRWACYNGPIVPGFVYAHDLLTCDEASLVEIAQQIGTPCYIYSGGLIRGRHAELSAAFHGYPHALHYALKANSTLALLRLLRSLGADADANSIGEIDVALHAGFVPSQIVFTGVGKTRDELERAVGLGLKAINAESAGELDRIDQIAR